MFINNRSRRLILGLPLGEIWPLVLVTVLCWISIVICLDPGGSYPGLPQGPGLTIDEVFNYEQGVYLVEQARHLGWLNLLPATSQAAYDRKNGYNPDHPPLGRWWLGVHHHLARWMFPPVMPEGPYVAACARTGSATAFALTVLMVGWFAQRWWGGAAGFLASISLCSMPRVYGHAHLASLETITNLTCTAAVLSTAHIWGRSSPPQKRWVMLTGMLLGLALLTKIQAVLIPIPVALWAMLRWRFSAIVPLLVWSAVAYVIFFVGWPYLWFDPLNHTLEFLGRATNRASLSVWYLGQKYADKSVPWHYPLVYFALTVPALFHACGLVGVFGFSSKIEPSSASPPNERSAWFVSRDSLVLGCTIFPLAVFAWPGVAVYDCERLFLTSFPLWAMFVGRGLNIVWRQLALMTKRTWLPASACAMLLLVEAAPVYYLSPYHLCYYNSIFQLYPALIDHCGLEIDYWGVSSHTRTVCTTGRERSRRLALEIGPTLHQFQAAEYERQSPILRRHGIKLTEWRDDDLSSPVLVYRRLADLSAAIRNETDGMDTIAVSQIGDLRLAYVVVARRRSPDIERNDRSNRR